MMQLNEMELKKLIQGGETNTVELKVATPRAVEMAERLCSMANAQGGMIILGVKDAQPEILTQNQSDQRERRLTQAIEYVQKYGFITNSIYRQLTGGSDRTAHRDLETLIERGRLKGTGQKAARR